MVSSACKRDLASWLLLLCVGVIPYSVFASGDTGSLAGGSVPVVVRVQGLALGSQLELSRAGEMLAATLNDEYTFSNQAVPGADLGIAVAAHPLGQACDISELAPTVVPADSSPVFIRCRSLPTPPVMVPETLPGGPLRVLGVASGVRPIAYPGLPYESRLAVAGGTFPYEFRVTAVTIDGTPVPRSGVMVDFRRGTLRFTPDNAALISIEFEIRDSAATQRVLMHTVAIQVAVEPFVFVAPGGVDSAGRGSLEQPYRTLGYALPRTTASQAIVLRRGTYATGGFMVDDSHAKTIMGYPDEVAEVDLNYAGSITVRIDQSPGARLEDLDIRRVQQYGIFSDPSAPGLVLRHLRFVEGREGPVPSENPAFVHGRG
ncbi:hypothetical protein, partial [Dokdonella sp.]|uniref:hypothetical protein n=1 Tax=Dokdonella sp. TaxID=2291710 RepID=UPI003C637927